MVGTTSSYSNTRQGSYCQWFSTVGEPPPIRYGHSPRLLGFAFYQDILIARRVSILVIFSYVRLLKLFVNVQLNPIKVHLGKTARSQLSPVRKTRSCLSSYLWFISHSPAGLLTAMIIKYSNCDHTIIKCFHDKHTKVEQSGFMFRSNIKDLGNSSVGNNVPHVVK